MTKTTDIYGAGVFFCQPCSRSSEDLPLPDSIRAWEVKRVHDDAGKLRAVKICSALLDSHLWVLTDPVFFHDELSFLAKKSVEELREIPKVKIAFPRCRVVQ